MFESTGEGTINTAAISLHEVYSSYMRAGFSTDQSFQLTLVTLKASFGQET